MMNIELLKQAKFSNNGSSMLKLIQNNSTPELDLIVRESVQNSLDAAKEQQSEVIVEFSFGKFNVETLANEFECISNEIKKATDEEKATFLSIKDKNTVGLTGDLTGDSNIKDKNQNLSKLVFQIMKHQEKEGAGGSWGIGKTVYFRIGIGLVIYYSRIQLESGEYQERLACSLIEDESLEKGLLSKIKRNTGIAFFGEKYTIDDNQQKIKAITDQTYIHRFLDIFHISPFLGRETGTNIIIPFINTKHLLENNQDDKHMKTWWQNNLDSYLKVSLLRWYFPRMSKEYNYGPKLVAYVNSKKVVVDENTPIFGKFMELYNAAYTSNFPKWIKKVRIERKIGLKDNNIGIFTYGVVQKKDIYMLPPDNLPNPYKYTMVENDEDDNNSPLIAFSRKPGMVVNYTNEGRCIGGLKNPKNKYIIGIFTLNSNNTILKPTTINLDEYVRQSEKADHTSWSDHSISFGDKKIRIVKTINNKTKEELSSAFDPNKGTPGDASLDMNFANMFAKLFLPSENFGNKGSTKKYQSKAINKKSGLLIKSQKKNKIMLVDKKYIDGDISLIYKVIINSNNKEIHFENELKTINGFLSSPMCEKYGLEFPCTIKKIALCCDKYANKCLNEQPLIIVPNNNEMNFKNYTVSFKTNSSNKVYSLKLDNHNNYVPIEFSIQIRLSSVDKLIESNFNISLKEAEVYE